MEINNELIKKLKKLSNIELNQSEEEKIKKDLNDLLDYLKILDEIDVDGVEEMISPVEFSTSVLRKDEVESFENRKEIINNFPESKDGFLRVPGIHVNEEE
ncbi:MAG: Asp-tRNA(Asn)/Glu-tRNA(Gln) amidotransferase subunit GatC [Thermotogota bacterium]|nr:Asp-tRNA(Asn)/Glu-tRNA(Gln) amidotransferase subunit GatC [Thermotogota bacterium]